ncbi:MAG: biotin--[acetyl-CoA-carboxylase] ligase [Acholeplasmataceae bacterium]|jgi:BirA family transcriptional regulator, biotin operon repressor / biotin---[acetyl-CoA-carboxylase] ligase
MSTTILEFEALDSTSDYLKENQQFLNHLTFVRADYQLKGRGQFDRTWESEKGLNLLTSLLLKPSKENDIHDIKNKILHALIDTLKQFHIHARYKAPNDLYVGSKKICGILIETQLKGEALQYVICGIGLNVNQIRFEAPNAISMRMLKNEFCDVKNIFNTFVSHITSVL